MISSTTDPEVIRLILAEDRRKAGYEKPMKLWILEPRPNLADDPWYLARREDVQVLVQVRAEGEARARALAQRNGGGETQGGYCPAWTDDHYSTCTELTAEGDEGIIMSRWEEA